MNILAIDTSCDETAAAVVENTTILSNIVWSQASLHAKFGGVYPTLAKREHESRIDWIVGKALKQAFPKEIVPNAYCLLPTQIDAIAVTAGPGLAPALEVGIKKAKELAKKYKLPLIPVNHIEAHLLSALAERRNSKSETRNPKQYSISNATNSKQTKHLTSNIQHPTSCFPALGLVVSGGNTQFVLINNIGNYKILAQTVDDALGEALDKAARMLGLGYPGGAILEKMARQGDPKSYALPVPMIGQEKKMIFSYSGLKTAMWKLTQNLKLKNSGLLTKEQICGLSASFQNAAFSHIIRVLDYYLSNHPVPNAYCLFLGGGVGANAELRKRLRTMLKAYGLKLKVPYSKKLYGDNAGMVGMTAYLKMQNAKKANAKLGTIERRPDWKLGEKW